MIRVLGDRVLVALPPKEHVQESATGYTYQEGQTTASGLILAKPADTFNVELATRGIVVQLGYKSNTVDLDDVRASVHEYFLDGEWDGAHVKDDVDRLLMKMQPAPFDVDLGDMVLFPPSAGDQIHQDGVDYVVLHETDIIGVVDPLNQASE